MASRRHLQDRYSRRRHAVEDQQHRDQPEDGVDDFGGEIHSREEQRKQAHVARDGKGSEGAKVASVLERQQAERDDDEEDGFFVDVPAEEEGSVAAERDGRDEGFPSRFQEELDQRRLACVSTICLDRSGLPGCLRFAPPKSRRRSSVV